MIGYDLHPSKGETYDELIEAIKSISGNNWWHCLDSTWLIKTASTSSQIRDALLKHIKKDDQLLVARYDSTNRDAAWYGFNQNCNDWLKDNL
jgi:hypothetical protein